MEGGGDDNGGGLPLPLGWTEHFSKTYQKTYYFNGNTGERRWDRPAPVKKNINTRPAAAPSKPKPMPKPKPIPKSKPAGGFSFLDSVLSNIQTTASTTKMNAGGASEAAKDAEKAEEEKFLKRVHDQIKAFKSNDGMVKLEFKPCDSDRRELIHEAALDHYLISKSEGLEEERHVVVYKVG